MHQRTKELADMQKRNKINNISLCILISASIFLLNGCTGLKTPEELIGPPETNLEKKITDETIRKFLPANSEIIMPQEKNGLSIGAIDQTMISEDNEDEIIALYRDKSSRKIGVIGIKKLGDIWSKIIDISLDAFEIADYYVVDLDSDGKSEILIGYFSSNTPFKTMIILGDSEGEFKHVYETEYLGFNIYTENNQSHNIAFSTIGADGKNNKFVIVNYIDGEIHKLEEYLYPEGIDIYRISYSKINDQAEGFYLDMYVNESIGKTDILGRVAGQLSSVLEKLGIGEITQSIPVASVDINNDGKIELIKNKFLPQENESIMVILNEYLAINNDNKLIPVMDIVEDHYNNIRISLPPLRTWELENHILVNSKKDAIKLYFESFETGEQHLLLEVKISPISEGYDGDYTLVAERGNYFILGKKLVLGGLSNGEKNKYGNFFDSIGNLLEIIKIIE